MNLQQTPQGQVNDWHDLPAEMFKELYDAGYRALHVRVDSKTAGRVPEEYARKIRESGMKIIATINPDTMWENAYPYVDGTSPVSVAVFALAEKSRLLAVGVDVNAEDKIEEIDAATNGAWSKGFCSRYRTGSPSSVLILNTFTGAGYIHLKEWMAKGARLHVQVHDVGEPMARSVQSILDFARSYGFTQLGKVKPQIGVFKRPDGSTLDVDAFVRSAQQAGTKGMCAYYMEGSLGDNMGNLKRLATESIRAGVCRL